MKHKTPLFLLISFLLTLSIFAGLMTYTLNQFNEVRLKSASIVKTNNTKVDLINIMHTAAKNRLLDMLLMVNIDDEFAVDDIFMDFNRQGALFADARYALAELPLTNQEKQLLAEQGRQTNLSVPIQREIVDYIQQGQLGKAIDLLNEKGVDAQNSTLETMQQLVELQSRSSKATLDEIEQQHKESVNLVFTWSFFALLFGSILAYVVFSKITRTEKQLSEINSELESRVEQRTKDLQKANGQLHESITSLEATQAQLIESEKLASLGGLVAGVAHEVNTPLGVGLTSSSLLREKIDQLELQVEQKKLTQTALSNFIKESHETCQILENNLYKAADLITNFKQLAVDQSSEQSYRFNIYETVHASMVSLNHLFKKHQIDAKIDCDLDLTAYGNSGALSQVITNLSTNAIHHAFEGIESNKNIEIIIQQLEDTLRIGYSDNGKGMSDEVLQKIYEPFFTTKRGQGGSGLGMNLVYNLVAKQLNGHISVSSIPNQGTQFIIDIPLNTQS